jgi:hypothetical protein
MKRGLKFDGWDCLRPFSGDPMGEDDPLGKILGSL